MTGEIVHYEIEAEDADRAQAFWSGLFGWEFGAACRRWTTEWRRSATTAGRRDLPVGQAAGLRERVPRDRRPRRVGGEDAGARRRGRGQDAGAGPRLVRRVQGHGGERVPPLAAGRVGRAIAPAGAFSLSSRGVTGSALAVLPLRGRGSRGRGAGVVHVPARRPDHDRRRGRIRDALHRGRRRSASCSCSGGASLRIATRSITRGGC